MKTNLQEKISVLIPAKGECEYLEFTMNSIKKSSLEPFEVIIIDDGINTNSLKNLCEFEKIMNIRIIKNKGEGLVDALNTGIYNANGKFIARIDADDLMLPNRLTSQLKGFSENKKLVAIGSNCFYINQEGLITGESNYPTGVLNCNKNFYFRCLIAHPSVLFRLDAANKVGGYRAVFTWKNIVVAEDFDFWLRLSDFGLIINLEEKLISYRQHPKQVTSKHISSQIVGTLYIAAVYKLKIKSPRKLFLNSFITFKTLYLLFIILKAFGGRKFIYTLLKIIQASFEKYSVLNGLTSKLFNFISAQLD